MIHRIILFAAFFVTAVFFSWLINSLLYRFSRTLGRRQLSRRRVTRWSATVKPSVGGFSFYIILLISLLFHMFFVHEATSFSASGLQGLFLAATLGFVLGLSDDAYDTIPLLKFFVQLICGITLAFTGTTIDITGQPVVNWLLTLLWVVGLMNAINMLDNMDGVAASVSFFILAALLLVLLASGQSASPYFLISLGVMAALLGFLRLNWQPARIYMGDTGSQLLGVCLAGMGIAVLWNYPDGTVQAPYLRYVLLAVVVFVVPLMDIGTVTLWRLSQGHSPFVGGRDHISHHLVYLGLSERQVVFVLAGASALGAVGALALVLRWQQIGDSVALLVFGLLLLLFVLTQYVYYLGKCKLKNLPEHVSNRPAAVTTEGNSAI